ncbi:MAG: sugar phosphate nucleotidyltransferase [Candidatus Daviesbacteria bacterium]|nr:sugar phosphate nucleotidyltransferase [Candidatus Daviesbacteria bacterium]
MKIIVLAAGEGKRMWPITIDKCLIPFLGKSLLYHNLKKIKENVDPDLIGVDGEFVIISTPQSKDEVTKIAQALNLKFQLVVQQQPKGMADALLSAKEYLEGEVLVVNAEDILDGEVYGEVAKGGADVVVAGLKVDKYFPGGYLKVDGDKVVGIVEKPGEGNEPSGMVKLVVDYFKDGKKLVEYLEKASSEQDDVYEKALDQMITDGMEVKFTKYDGVWIPLKYPWQILDILEHLLQDIEQQISPGANVSEKATITGKVIIEEGVRVFEGAVIKGPCYIGKNVIVGNNTMIRESDLEEGCVTGFSSDITRSYIGANSWFHTNYIGDSVIEGDFGMGSGAVLANLRLDDHTIRVGEEEIDSGRHKLGLMAGKGSRIAVNASAMPGARVGSNSLIGPGVVLYGDVKENKKVLVKQELEITEHTPALTSYDQFREKLKK